MRSTNISWLKLEQYALKELDLDSSRQVEAELARSVELRERLNRIVNEIQRPLRALPPPREPRLTAWRRLFEYRFGLVLAFAIVICLLVIGRVGLQRERFDDKTQGIKGNSAPVLSLIRRSGDFVQNDADSFVSGDEFQVVVTCVDSGLRPWQLAIFEGNQVGFPLDSSQPWACGNRVLLPGAFRARGGAPMLVCLSRGDDVVDPELLRSAGIKKLKPTAVCVPLRPVE